MKAGIEGARRLGGIRRKACAKHAASLKCLSLTLLVLIEALMKGICLSLMRDYDNVNCYAC